MVSAQHGTVWHMGRTDATVAFLTEACVAYFTRADFREGEREALGAEIERLVRGEAELFVRMSVDDWLTERRSPKRENPSLDHLPLEIAWQVGKTGPTVAFVKEAERRMTGRGSDLTSTEEYQLRAKIDRLKAGDESCDETDTVDDWLERLRDHYP
jgi:hypothetical protein